MGCKTYPSRTQPTHHKNLHNNHFNNHHKNLHNNHNHTIIGMIYRHSFEGNVIDTKPSYQSDREKKTRLV